MDSLYFCISHCKSIQPHLLPTIYGKIQTIKISYKYCQDKKKINKYPISRQNTVNFYEFNFFLTIDKTIKSSHLIMWHPGNLFICTKFHFTRQNNSSKSSRSFHVSHWMFFAILMLKHNLMQCSICQTFLPIYIDSLNKQKSLFDSTEKPSV